MSDAGKWKQPLFPEPEIPYILAALERCLRGLKKAKPRELETSLNSRLRVFLQRDAQLRDRPVEVDREKILDDLETGEEGRLDITSPSPPNTSNHGHTSQWKRSAFTSNLNLGGNLWCLNM